MRAREFVLEAAYPGNLGMMEMFRFFRIATPEQQALMRQLIAQDKKKLAWELLKHVTGVDLRETLRSDIPNQYWLDSKQRYARERGRNRYGVPYMGTVTGSFSKPVTLPVSLLRRLPGMTGEQKNVRQHDLAAIMKIMRDTGRLPQHNGRDYVPFINVAWNGEAWVNEGNHRIMAAAELGWPELPVEIKYFDGGELADGPLNPRNLGLGHDTPLDEDLRKWFREKWVRFNPQGKIMGPCARGDDREGKPKCLPQAKAHSIGQKGRKYAASKKRREDPDPGRRGPAKNVATKKKSNEGFVPPVIVSEDIIRKMREYPRSGPNAAFIGDMSRLIQRNGGLTQPQLDMVKKNLNVTVAEGKVSGYKMCQNPDGTWYVENEKVVLRNASKGKAEHMVSVGDKKMKQGVKESIHTVNKLFVKKIESESALIEHAKIFSRNLSLDGVPITSKNRYTVVCSTIFSHHRDSLNESKHITGGRQVIQLLRKLDQFDQLSIRVGAKVAIINSQLQGDSIELWGFTTPKTISKIYLDPLDKSVKQFEFNNDPDDVWPRTDNAEYNGQFLMYSAFFGDQKSADHALTLLMLQASGDLSIRNHIKQQELEEQSDELKCWPGYTRVKGVAAGNPGSCKKKTTEDTVGSLMTKNLMGFDEEKCPHCDGPMFEMGLMNEKKDACYYKVKGRYRVWPSAYASGALVQCRKKGAANWGNKSESLDRNRDSVTGITAANPRVYLDMDGVLADFVAGYNHKFGTNYHSNQELPPAKVDKNFPKLVGTDFFQTLPRFDSAPRLVQAVVKIFGHYNISSSPLRGDHENSGRNKRAWLMRNLSPNPRDIVITSNKEKNALQPNGTPNILVDDKPRNIQRWQNAGGIGILYNAAVDSVDDVITQLEKIADQYRIMENVANRQQSKITQGTDICVGKK